MQIRAGLIIHHLKLTYLDLARIPGNQCRRRASGSGHVVPEVLEEGWEGRSQQRHICFSSVLFQCMEMRCSFLLPTQLGWRPQAALRAPPS